MEIEDKIEIGAIQISPKALEDIALEALKDIQGVTMACPSWSCKLVEFFGKKSYSGIKATIDRNNDVSIEVRVNVQFNLSIPLIAKTIQQSIKSAVEKTTDINLKSIDVKVQGIERGNI
jgi:uncharacterized alkaline shock family protein YloU